MAADTTGGAHVQRDPTTGRPFVRRPSTGYVGRHRLVPADDSPAMPQNLWFRPSDDVRDAVTAYLLCVGTLDPEQTDQASDSAGEHAAERAAATQAARQRTEPDHTFLQRVLDGLRRL
jgi:hypothetical protein